jgi:DNA-binding transcriptional LysR family regulator
MAASEWLRTFVAVYRSGSVSAGASRRGLSQPAASQQLASLERRVGRPLFTRTSHGVEPTRRGRELHAQVADSLDRLEQVLTGLEGGPVAAPDPVVRLGSSAEYFSAAVVPRLRPGGPALEARFGSDRDNLARLEHGELDVAVTSTMPSRRSLTSQPIGMKRFLLVSPTRSAPVTPAASLTELGAWLVGRPWVAYSAELPLTRRFWVSALGRPFAGDLRLVAPDLRAVAAAVERGLGCSLLPDFSCAGALERGTMVELHPIARTVPSEPWFVCTRVADLDRAPLAELVTDLAGAALSR